MWSLTLSALAALTISVNCKMCPDLFEPLNKTMLRLELNGSRSWPEVDSMCKVQFPGGFVMLSRDFLGLSAADKALCPQGQSVPLGVQKTELGPIKWRKSGFLNNEEDLNSTYLARKRDTETQNETAHAQVGSLDLTTNQWRLVDNDTNFTCAICQRAWLDRLDRVYIRVPPRPGHLNYAFTFRLVKTGSHNVTVDEVLSVAVDNLNRSVDEYQHPNGIRAEFEKMVGESGGVGNGTSVRVRASYWYLQADDVSEALNGSYAVESWWNADMCPDARLDGTDWKATRKGLVGQATLPDFHVATKRCWVRMRGDDGDYDAVWLDEVSSWLDRGESCKAQGSKNLLLQLEDFAARSTNELSLESLVAMTTEITELKWPHDDFYLTNGNVSTAIHGALSALLVATETTRGAYSACDGNACALLTAHVKQDGDPDTADYSLKDAPPTFRDSNVIDHASFNISIEVTSRSKSASRMAMQIVQAGDNYKRIFDPQGYFDTTYVKHALLVHVTSAMPFQAWQAEGKWPMVIFHVNNTGLRFYFTRYLSVWSLGDSEESTLPCPLIRKEGLIETFVCNKYVSGPRNFTSGTFLALSVIRQDNPFVLVTKQMGNVFLGYAEIPVDESALRVVTDLTNKLVNDSAIYSQYVDTSIIHGALEKILSGAVLNDTVVTVTLPHVKVLVSKLTGSGDPVVGFSLDGLAGVGPTHTIAAGERNNVSSESAIDLVLGANVEQHCKQIAILAVSNFTDFYPDGSLGGSIKRKLMVVHLVATSRSTPDASSIEAVYLDIQLHRDRMEDQSGVVANDSNRRFLVATWSYEESDWYVSTCGKLRSTRASKQVFRCQQLAITGNEFRGRFLIFESFRFADALGETWLGVLIAAGVLSGVSLASIFGTAATQASWRDDLGHKILMQMTLALTLNLALGFASPFVSFDTTGVPCVVVGALRHFSYLAMFAWMLVMSGLQLRRLLSVIGSRATSNLLPKVCLLAWGLPTVAVAALLTLNTSMYRSDVADRGFCYPEGGHFVWSVQVPAAVILTLNGVIFVVIVARLYGFCGWGGKEDLRRHQDERTFQMRRLKAIFFTFCLFGITWVFHLLAEQGVFQRKFIYEYIFLLTASLHVFFLACIFVFCDEEVRVEWAKIFTSLSQVRKDGLRVFTT